MTADLVLITGATGHLGFRVLRYALEFGYNVRAAVRSEAKAKTVRSNSLLKDVQDSQLSFAIVPDFLAPGAFDEAVRGVKYIIHVASPLSTRAPEGFDANEYFFRPAIKGTMGVFESAKKTDSVERIVVTSSVVAIQPLSTFRESDGGVLTAESRIPVDQGPYPVPFAAYAASKAAALNEAEKWMKTEKPRFDAIHIHPSFIFGRDDTASTTPDFQTGTNRLPLNIALGNPAMPGTVNNFNNVEDNAKIHVLSLDPKIKGNQSFLVSNDGRDGMTWEDVNKIVAKHFPEQVKNGTLPNNGHMFTVVSKVDISKTEKTFGFKLASFEDTVVSVVEHYLEVLETEKKAGEQ
jgi:nucleoside-diphosphate-sugar epimerase